MRSSITIPALLASLAAVNGKIVGMTTAPQAKIGAVTEVTIQNAPWIINFDEYGLIWGLKQPSNTCDSCLGEVIGYKDISKNNPLGNTTYEVTIPDYMQPGNYIFVAGIPHTVGISGEADLDYFKADMLLVA